MVVWDAIRTAMKPEKKDMDSWDRGLSIGNVKWSVRDHKNVKKGHHVFGFWIIKSSPHCRQPDFVCFGVADDSKKLNLASKNQFWFQIKNLNINTILTIFAFSKNCATFHIRF